MAELAIEKFRSVIFLGGEGEVLGLRRPAILVADPDHSEVVRRHLQVGEGVGHGVPGVVVHQVLRIHAAGDDLPAAVHRHSSVGLPASHVSLAIIYHQLNDRIVALRLPCEGVHGSLPSIGAASHVGRLR